MIFADRAFNLLATAVQKPALYAIRPQKLLRRAFALQLWLTARPLWGVAVEKVMLGPEGTKVSAIWQRPPGVAEEAPVLIYLHGGGFTIGGFATHRHLSARLAQAAGARALFVEYRLAPEHPFPAAPDDVLVAYRALLEQGISADQIAIAGDSAGGCLALSLLHRITAEGLPRPAALGLLSPVVDLALDAQPKPAKPDRLLPQTWVKRAVRCYLADCDPADPVASPLHGQLDQAPPTCIHIATDEMLEPQGLAIAERLRAGGGQVVLERFDDVAHVWQLNAGWSATADRAVARMGAFLAQAFNATAR